MAQHEKSQNAQTKYTFEPNKPEIVEQLIPDMLKIYLF